MRIRDLKQYAGSLGYRIIKAYQSFRVKIGIAKVHPIPFLQRFVFMIDILPGTRVQKVFAHATDVQVILKFFLFYPFRMGEYVLLAVSEFNIRENRLLKILNTKNFLECDMQIPLAIGYDLMGDVYITDLAKLFHLLIVGPSGTGKSMAMQCMLVSIMVKCSPEFARLILFDIGANSLELFKDLEHLYHPIVKDTETGIMVLESLVAEIDRRIKLGEEECRKLPFIICAIDEFDDTIAGIDNKGNPQRFVSALNSVIRRGRKAKVILILASHDPSLKNAKVNINGIIPRIVFKCANHYSSLTALGVTGAENLPGGGAMLFKSQDEGVPKLLQGSYITETEIKQLLSNRPKGYVPNDVLDIKYPQISGCIETDMVTIEKENKELADILLWVLGHKMTSTLQIQKKFRIGKRASEIMDILYNMGIVTEKFTNQPRKVIPDGIKDLKPETIHFLTQFKYDIEEIEKAFKGR